MNQRRPKHDASDHLSSTAQRGHNRKRDPGRVLASERGVHDHGATEKNLSKHQESEQEESAAGCYIANKLVLARL